VDEEGGGGNKGEERGEGGSGKGREIGTGNSIMVV